MERLTLDEAINRSRKLAERHRWNSENTKLETSDKNANEVYKNTCIQYANQEEQYAKWLEELKSYRDIGIPKELKEFKENGAFTGLELVKLAIMQKELKEYKDLEEQGLLVRLPDDKNAEIYLISSRWTVCSECGSRFDEYNCIGCEYECDSKKEYYICTTYLSSIDVNTYANRFGKTIFFAREEAKKKLEEMQNDRK